MSGPSCSSTRRTSPGDHEILVRAWDSSAATRPEDEAGLWNPKGHVNNPPEDRGTSRPRITSSKNARHRYTIAELAELFSVSRATIYREIARARRDPS